MTSGLIVIEQDSVIDITIDRPDAGNRIDEETGTALARILEEAPPDTHLIRLRSKGDDFCAGRQSPQFDRSKATASQFRQFVAAGPLRLYAAFRNARAPVLAEVQGLAAGLGCTLAALCDLSIAADDARFLVPELDHGIPPMLVMSALRGRVPYKGIAHLVYSRTPVSASNARELGIVGEVVPPEELRPRADLLARRILDAPRESVRAVKEYLTAAIDPADAGAVALASTLIATTLSSKDRT